MISAITSSFLASFCWRSASFFSSLRPWGLPSRSKLACLWQGGGAALEELLLPAAEEVWIQPLLIAEVGDGDSLQQVPAEDVKFPLRRELPSRGHGHLPGSVNILTADPEMSISV